MNLPDLLRERGVDPEDFLARALNEREDINIRPSYGGSTLISSYVGQAISWALQPEGEQFWDDMDGEWYESTSRDRWPALEAAMGFLEPLEAELMEVEDAST